MSAIEAGFQFLKERLDDATLLSHLPGGIHQTIGPIGTNDPFGLFALSSPQNVLSATAVRIYSPNLYLVKAVGPATSNADLRAADNRMAALLDLVNGVVDAGLIMACYQETPFYYTELKAGVLWIHTGGLYRIQIK